MSIPAVADDERWWRTSEGVRYISLTRDLDEHHMEMHDLRETLTADANRLNQGEEEAAGSPSALEYPALSVRTISEDSTPSGHVVMTAPPTIRRLCLDAAGILCYTLFMICLFSLLAYNMYLVFHVRQRAIAAIARLQNTTE
jgi:hypothetical protein